MPSDDGLDELLSVLISPFLHQEQLESKVSGTEVLVDCSPETVTDAIDTRTHLVQVPSGTPPGFPLAQVVCEERAEVNASLAEGLMADLDAALAQEFLHVSVTQGKAVVQPDGVLDDAHGETVVVRLGVGQSVSRPQPD